MCIYIYICGSPKTLIAHSSAVPSELPSLWTLSSRLQIFFIKDKTMSIGELACSYAVIALHDDGIPVTAEKIATILAAANVKVDSYWPGLFAKLAEKRNIDDLILSAGAAGGGAPVAFSAPAGGAAGGAEAAAAAPAEEKKKEEPAEESDDDMGFGLFD